MVPQDKLYVSPSVGVGMVCGTCLFEMTRELEARQRAESRKEAIIELFGWRIGLLVLCFVLTFVYVWLDTSGYRDRLRDIIRGMIFGE